jgi:xylulose-5-phosphate/fructose-6-phosphate phosphoketolase
MVVLNEMSRFHLAAEALRCVPRLGGRGAELVAQCEARIAAANAYAHEHLEDEADVRDWVWTD